MSKKLNGIIAGLFCVTTLLFFASVPVSHTAFPGANGKIVFHSNRDGNYEIYTMNADGSDQKRLTNNNDADLYPTFSPDGSKIAFSSNRDGNNEVYIMNSDGSGQVNLTNNAADDLYKPTFSPDGTKIAFLSNRDGNTEIYVMNSSDGSGQINLTNTSAGEGSPAWSPDGTKIAFSKDVGASAGRLDIYVMNSDGSGQTPLITSPLHDDSPNWSPDGSKIAFTSDRVSLFNNDIYVANAYGSGQTRLTTTAMDHYPAWSPDGTKIAFGSYRSGNGEIYTMNPDGSSQINRSNNTSWDDSPDWQSAPVQATFDLKPDTLNLKSAGKFVTGYIELPQGNNVNDIVINSVRLQDSIQAYSKPTGIGDYDNDGIADLMLKFSRKSLIEKLSKNNNLKIKNNIVKIKITGILKNNIRFEGEDKIRVIKPRKK